MCHVNPSPSVESTTIRLQKSLTLGNLGLKDNTKAVIIAAEEQPLRTRSIEPKISHREAYGKFQHRVAGCMM